MPAPTPAQPQQMSPDGAGSPAARPAAAPGPQQASPGYITRMRRLFRPDGRTVILPCDHGMVLGPLPGITDPVATVQAAVDGGADALILHQGLARMTAAVYGGRAALIYKLTDGCCEGTLQEVLGSVEQAVSYGADAFSVEFYIGAPNELALMRDIGRAQRAAERLGLPMVAHAYVHPAREQAAGASAWIHAARVAAELGADVVKTSYPGDDDTFRQVLAAAWVPVVVAGGERADTLGLLRLIDRCVDLGAAGVAIGRNAWGTTDPAATIAAIAAVVHTRTPPDDAMLRPAEPGLLGQTAGA
jgi:DhnA family fructose-bisphosphate aldolase class Ia